MASFAKIATKILKYLNDCYEGGRYANIEALNANVLGVLHVQFYKTMKMLATNNYLSGVEFQDVIPPEDSVMNAPTYWDITPEGIQYLEENRMIRKAYKVLKETKDWLPLT